MPNVKAQMSNGYKLRKATENDFQLAYDIRKNALGEYVKQTWGWDEALQMKMHTEDFDTDILQIIEVDGKPIGTLEKSVDANQTTVSGLYIVNEYQGRGIGRDIMKNIINESNGKQIKLQVLKVNQKAKIFYERFSFSSYEENTTHYKMIYKHK